MLLLVYGSCMAIGSGRNEEKMVPMKTQKQTRKKRGEDGDAAKEGRIRRKEKWFLSKKEEEGKERNVGERNEISGLESSL